MSKKELVVGIAVEIVRADAKRYRWLRECNLSMHPRVLKSFLLGDKHLDDAIDEAMLSESGEITRVTPLSTAMHLKLELYAGSKIEEAAAELCTLADATGVPCEAEFNDVKIEARPGNSTEQLVEAYYKSVSPAALTPNASFSGARSESAGTGS